MPRRQPATKANISRKRINEKKRIQSVLSKLAQLENQIDSMTESLNTMNLDISDLKKKMNGHESKEKQSRKRRRKNQDHQEILNQMSEGNK